jgi:methylenetetrahydrofolate reductase (NADPH)
MYQEQNETPVTVAAAQNKALTDALAHPRFELVPIRGVEEEVAFLPRGATVTITCSPTRGIEHTLLVAERLAEYDLHIVPHIAARLVRDRAHLQDVVQLLTALGLREVFVVGGDAREPAGIFAGADEMLPVLAELAPSLTQIGIPAYPERHPLIDDATLQRALWKKQPYATYMVTQICFDAGVILRWLERERKQGVTLPVYVGLPGALDPKQLLRISMKIGVGDSMRFLSKHSGLAFGLFRKSETRVDAILEGIAPALADPGYNIRGLHINTFNQVASTEAWRQDLLRRAEG